jgi:hypothetical protein
MSTSSFTIKVLLFASAREAAGNVSMVHVELQEGSDAFQLRYVWTKQQQQQFVPF